MKKAIATKTNKNGVSFALIQDGETFGVWKMCENYCRHVKGGIAKSWRYVEKDMALDAAQSLFNRRAA